MKEASWTKFANTLGYKELARLDKLGIAYHIPVPGARYWSTISFQYGIREAGRHGVLLVIS